MLYWLPNPGFMLPPRILWQFILPGDPPPPEVLGDPGDLKAGRLRAAIFRGPVFTAPILPPEPHTGRQFQHGIEGDVPLGRLWVFMFGAEDLETLASLLPSFISVGFHGVDEASLPAVVDEAEGVDEVVDVEDHGVGGQGNDDDENLSLMLQRDWMRSVSRLRGGVTSTAASQVDATRFSLSLNVFF